MSLRGVKKCISFKYPDLHQYRYTDTGESRSSCPSDVESMELKISSSGIEDVIDITHELERIVDASEAVEGICHVFAKDSSCAIIADEKGPDMKKKISYLTRVLLSDKNDDTDGRPEYSMKDVGPLILGRGISIPIRQGRVDLFRSQAVWFIDFDDPKLERVISVQVISD